MTNPRKYQEQLERVHRWYDRIKRINDGMEHDKPSECYQDEIYAFYLNCYHLKDWIINCDAAPNERVEEFINSSTDLKLCADICNGLKHLKLDRQPRSDQRPEFGPRRYELNIGSGPITIAVKFSLDIKSGSIDAFELATKCLESWGSFVSSIQ